MQEGTAMPKQDVVIKTRDGDCPASVFTPSNGDKWPAVIFYMDAPGVRPVLEAMAQRISDDGYVVLLPDLFYRWGPNEPVDPMKTFSTPELRDAMMGKLGMYDLDKKNADTKAFIEYLDSRSDVAGDKFGSTGYCMGGNCSLTAAGAFPDRFAASASFHGGWIANEMPDSPHQFLPGFKGRIYVAGASDDPMFTEENKALLEKTLTDGGVDHVVETYEGALHGFAPDDMPVYDKAASDRHWRELLKLFRETLQAS